MPLEITGLFAGGVVPQYIVPIDTQDNWVSYRHQAYPVNSASKAEARFNTSGEVAYYLASGDETAKNNLKDISALQRCLVTPQTLNCFDLAQFSRDFGIEDQFLKSKSEGGYPLTQATANHLSKNFGVTGILYTSFPDHRRGREGLCIVLRPQDGGLVGRDFFDTGIAPH